MAQDALHYNPKPSEAFPGGLLEALLILFKSFWNSTTYAMITVLLILPKKVALADQKKDMTYKMMMKTAILV